MRTEHPADPALRPYVECLWSVERRFAPPADAFTLLPDRHVELVFSAGARFVVDAATPLVLPGAYVVGLLDGPVRLRACGTVRAVAARCHAWSVAPLLAPLLAPLRESGDAPGALPGGIRPLHDAHAPLARGIAARLDGGDVGGALGLLADALRPLVAAAPAVPGHVRRAGRALGAAPGAALGNVPGGGAVRRAAAAGGRTPRQLERQFRALAGVTPKGYARRARFEHARDRLWADPHAALSALAVECGYADQAHLTREFRTFADTTPARWAGGVARTRALLHAPRGGSGTRDVAFLQAD